MTEKKHIVTEIYPQMFLNDFPYIFQKPNAYCEYVAFRPEWPEQLCIQHYKQVALQTGS